MGNFYVNFSVKSDDQAPVADALRKAGRHAVVAPPEGGYVVVYEEASDTQDERAIKQVGALLCEASQAPVVAVLNHDDDVFCYWLFEGGEVADAYNSTPDYFDEADDSEQGGDPARLCASLGAAGKEKAVEAVMRDERMMFAVDRHMRLADLLGLPKHSIGLGYMYIAQGELPDGVDEDAIVRID
jgi:hypothetical protein